MLKKIQKCVMICDVCHDEVEFGYHERLPWQRIEWYEKTESDSIPHSRDICPKCISGVIKRYCVTELSTTKD